MTGMETFKKALKITNNNIILTVPIIIFMWITGIYLAFSRGAAVGGIQFLVAVMTILFMFGAFMSGWLYQVKKAVIVEAPDGETSKPAVNLFRLFPEGVGKYFLSFVGFSLLSMLILSFYGLVVFKLGISLAGNLDLSPAQIKQAMISQQDMKAFLDSLTESQIVSLVKWELIFLTTSSILSFLLMFWIPEIMFYTKNSFIALFRSIKKLFVKPLKSIQLFLAIALINLILSFISTFTMENIYLYLLMSVLYFYFILYVVVLLFLYYANEMRAQNDIEA